METFIKRRIACWCHRTAAKFANWRTAKMKFQLIISILITFVFCFTASQLPDINKPSSIFRSEIQSSPNSNCTVLEKEYKTTWKNIRLPHSDDCTKFYECDGPILIEKQCPAPESTRYDPFHKVCEFNKIVPCITYGYYSEIFNGENVVTSEAGAQSFCRY